MSFARSLLACVAGLVAVALIAPGAVAHAAPRPRDYETRLIHDCVDDYFGGDQPGGSRDGHDVMALDVRESYDDTLDADVLVFRVLINDDAHSGSELKDEVSFTAKGQAKKYAFTTSNNQEFAGTFERVAGPQSLNDGQRFGVDGTLKLSTLGLKVGDKISGFKVESFIGGTRGDFMPGSYDSNLGAGGTSCPVGSQGGDTIRPDYTIQGPVQYASWSVEPTKVTVPMGTPQLINLHLTNELRTEAQTFTLDADADPGVQAKFHDLAANQYKDPYEFTMDKDVENHLVHLQLTGQTAGAKGTVVMELRTSLGGRLIEEVEFTVGNAGATTGAGGATTSDDAAPDGGAPSPGVGAMMLALAVVVFAGRRRP